MDLVVRVLIHLENLNRNKHVESVWLPCLDEGSTPSISTSRTRSLMDKIKDSGSFALGSIPSGFTKMPGLSLAFFYFFSVMITSMAPTPNLAMLAIRFSVFL